LVYGYDEDFLSYLKIKFAINSEQFPLVSREKHRRDSIIKVGKVQFGGGCNFPIIAGPCGLKSEKDSIQTAIELKGLGVDVFRGFIWKGRTNPSSFQGVGETGINWLRKVKEQTNLPIDTEILSENHLKLIKDIVDVIQIGARNMQNYELLKAVGSVKIPVILKNGPGAGIDELLCAAEYIARGGNKDIILCLRGTKSLAGSGSRFTLDMSGFAILKRLTHLPVIGDPTHPADHNAIIPSVAMGIAACGADGLLIEVYNKPEMALTDKKQLIDYSQFAKTMHFINGILATIGKKNG
jgi:3-deoxy-7-phosphoheptulonate synthase